MPITVVCTFRPEAHGPHEWFSSEHSRAAPPAVLCPGRCVINVCRDPVDLREVVEMSSPERPYKALRRACLRHLEMFRNIGLPVLRLPQEPSEPN